MSSGDQWEYQERAARRQLRLWIRRLWLEDCLEGQRAEWYLLDLWSRWLEMEDRMEVLGALYEVNTFDLSSPCDDVSDLSDGVALSECLLEIAPGLFDPSAIKRDVRDNWALKLNNLKKLLFNLETFYRESLNAESLFAIDLSSVARAASPDGIRALVQLLVGAAVSCGGKADYIQAIMQMSVEGQEAMQQVVQDAMMSISPLGGEGALEARGEDEGGGGSVGGEGQGHGQEGGEGEGDVGGLLERSVSRDQREEEWALRLAESEDAMIALRRERDQEAAARVALEREASLLRERMHEMEAHASARTARDEETSVMSDSLQSVMSSLEEKGARLQQALQESRVADSRLEQEIKARTEKEFELRQLEDELDIAKAKAAQLTKMEATVEKYKRRLEDMAELRQQVKELDELNSKYLDQMLKLESTAKTIPTLTKKIEQYKNQAVELERQNFEATSAVVVKDTEVNSLREELEAATQAKMFFEDELIALRDQNKAHADALEEDPSKGNQRDLFEGAANRAELREQVARQVGEIALLKARVGEGGDAEEEGGSRLEVLESQLEHAHRIKDERSAEALAAKRNAADLEQKNHKLEELVAEMRGAPESAAQAEKSTSKMRGMKEEMDKLRAAAADRERLSMTAQSLEDRLKERETQVNNLQTDKEKLESYTKKTLHKFQDKYMVAISHCKAQIAEKNEKIDYLESKVSQDKASAKREERLLMSSVYELGMDIIERQLKSSVSDQIRGAESAPNSSWMQRQRAQAKKSNPVALCHGGGARGGGVVPSMYRSSGFRGGGGEQLGVRGAGWIGRRCRLRRYVGRRIGWVGGGWASRCRRGLGAGGEDWGEKWVGVGSGGGGGARMGAGRAAAATDAEVGPHVGTTASSAAAAAATAGGSGKGSRIFGWKAYFKCAPLSHNRILVDLARHDALRQHHEKT
eukprot:jgi/Undpi1/11830/HiC_scaffold_4.g01529.m1